MSADLNIRQKDAVRMASRGAASAGEGWAAVVTHTPAMGATRLRAGHTVTLWRAGRGVAIAAVRPLPSKSRDVARTDIEPALIG